MRNILTSIAQAIVIVAVAVSLAYAGGIIKRRVVAGGGLSLPQTDNFNRTNANPMDGTWLKVTGTSDVQLISDAAGPVTSGWAKIIRAASETWPSDQYSQATITSTNLGWRGIFVRFTVGNSGYAVHFDETTYYINRIDSGTETTLGSSGFWTAAVSNIIKLSVTGDNVSLYRNGSLVASRTDNTHSSGSPGFGFYDAVDNQRMDDWGGGAP